MASVRQYGKDNSSVLPLYMIVAKQQIIAFENMRFRHTRGNCVCQKAGWCHTNSLCEQWAAKC